MGTSGSLLEKRHSNAAGSVPLSPCAGGDDLRLTRSTGGAFGLERGGEAAQTVGRLRVVVPLREGSGEIGAVGEDRRGAEMLLCGARGAYICRFMKAHR